MRPPICGLCDRRFGPDEGGLVSFRRRPEDEDWDARASREGFVGHPPYQEWFCGEHLGIARGEAQHTRPEAMARMRARLGL